MSSPLRVLAFGTGFALAFIASTFLPSLCCQPHAFTSLDTFLCQLRHLLLHESPVLSLGFTGALSFPLPVTRNGLGFGLMVQLLHFQENRELLRVAWGTPASESALGVSGCSCTFGLGLGLGFAVGLDLGIGLGLSCCCFLGELLQPLEGLQNLGLKNLGRRPRDL